MDAPKTACHPVCEAYCETVALSLIAKDAHLRTLATEFVFHGYSGDVYDALTAAVDRLGEQLVNLGQRVPPFTEAINSSCLDPIDTDDAKKLKAHLLDANAKVLAKLMVSSKDAALDEGSRTILADRILDHGQTASRLKSLQ
jgi:DNA-binding ferritin-like protein